MLTIFSSKQFFKNNNSSKNSPYKTYNFTNLNLFKKKVTSNASRSSFELRTKLPILNIFRFKKLLYKLKSTKGRTKKGTIVCRTKGKNTINSKKPVLNKNFRSLYLSFTAGFFLYSRNLKSYSIIISSAGEISYVSATYKHSLFQVSKLHNIFFKTQSVSNYYYLSKFIKLSQIFYLINQLPKFKFVSSLEIYPNKKIQYVQSPGSKSFISKIDLKTNLALVKLPSGVHKVFSTYSIASLGVIPFSYKNIRTQAKAGFFQKKGHKPLSRGVAKNPVDHPHGGRNKAIRYQRTP